MPIICDTDARLEYVLKSDQGKPKAKQTVFLFSPLTVSQYGALMAMQRTLNEAEGDNAEIIDKVVDLCFGILKGWSRFILYGKELKFTRENMGYLTFGEIQELIQQGVVASEVTDDDEKK